MKGHDEELLAARVAALGLRGLRFLPATALVIEEAVLEACRKNVCGNYGRNHMCPPAIGTLTENRAFILGHDQALLFRKDYTLDVQRDSDAVRDSRLDFHRRALALEQSAQDTSWKKAFALIGGDCAWCPRCTCPEAPCLSPDKARPSLESLGVNVISLLEENRLEAAFHDDKIAWTGALLLAERAL